MLLSCRSRPKWLDEWAQERKGALPAHNLPGWDPYEKAKAKALRLKQLDEVKDLGPSKPAPKSALEQFRTATLADQTMRRKAVMDAGVEGDTHSNHVNFILKVSFTMSQGPFYHAGNATYILLLLHLLCT